MPGSAVRQWLPFVRDLRMPSPATYSFALLPLHILLYGHYSPMVKPSQGNFLEIMLKAVALVGKSLEKYMVR